MNIYHLTRRVSSLPNPFVADTWDLKGCRPEASFNGRKVLNDAGCDVEDIPAVEREFSAGNKFLNWPKDVWFGATTQEMDGDLDDFIINNAMAPLITRHLSETLKSLNLPDHQMLPAEVVWHNGRRERAFILNFTKLVPCLDVEKTIVISWYPEAWRNPSQRGKIRSMIKPTIISKNIDGFDLFRSEEFPCSLFGSEKFKNIFINGGMTGVGFDPVRLS